MSSRRLSVEEYKALHTLDEAAYTERVRQIARLNGWRTYHTHDSRRSEPGFPDLVLVRAPRLVFAELKTERGLLSDDQAAWLAELQDCTNVEAYTWRPGDGLEVVLR